MLALIDKKFDPIDYTIIQKLVTLGFCLEEIVLIVQKIKHNTHPGLNENKIIAIVLAGNTPEAVQFFEKEKISNDWLKLINNKDVLQVHLRSLVNQPRHDIANDLAHSLSKDRLSNRRSTTQDPEADTPRIE